MTTVTGFIAGLAFLLLAGLGAGWRYRAEPAVALTLGLGLLAAAVAWSGLLGLLTLPWLLTCLTMVALAGALVRPADEPPAPAAGPPRSRLEKLVLAVIAAHLLIHALAVLVPPIGWDALTYHLTLPSFYLRAGTLADHPGILNSTFPQGVEMLYLFTLWFEPLGHLAMAVNFIFLALLVILAVKLARALAVPRPWPLLAGLAVLLMPMTNRFGGYHNTDVPLAAFSTLALLMLARGRPLPALLAAALAASMKYTGLIVLVLVAAALPACELRAGGRAVVRVAGVALVMLLLAAGPWLARNYAHTGNPVFPFARAFFENPAAAAAATVPAMPGGLGATIFTQVAGQYADKGLMYDNRLTRLLFFPFDVTLNFAIFDEWRYALGPLYLALLPAGLFFVRGRAPGTVLAVALVYAVLVVQLVPNARYLLPVLPALAAVALLGAAGLAGRRRWWRPLLLVLLLGWGLLNLPLAAAQHFDNLRLLARDGYSDFYARKLPFLDGIDYLHRALGTDRAALTAQPWRARPRACVVDKRVFPLGFETLGGVQEGMPRAPFVLAGDLPEQAAQLAAALHAGETPFVVVGLDFARRYRETRVWNACEYLVAHGQAARIFTSANSIVYQLP